MLHVYRRSGPFLGQGSQRIGALPVLTLDYRLAINAPAEIRLVTARDASVALYDLVEIERDDAGAPECEVVGIVTEIERGDTQCAIRAEGLLSVLGWRVVAYYAGTSGKSAFSDVKVETLVKTIVGLNFGAQATTGNGRLLDGAVTWLEIEADQGRGTTLASRGCAWRSVLTECVDLAEIGNADIDVALTTGGMLRLVYMPRPATPAVTHVFGPEWGNVARWAVRETAHTASAVIAAGAGEQDERETAVVASSDAPAREVVRHATWDGADLAREAAQELNERGTDVLIDWHAAQTHGSRYWRDYRLGSYVAVSAGGQMETQRIVSVSAHVEGAYERVDIETREAGGL